MLEKIMEYLPLLIPLMMLQLGLMIFALIHAIKHPRYKIGNRVIWIFVIVLVNIIGPVLYFVFGREEHTDNMEDKL